MKKSFDQPKSLRDKSWPATPWGKVVLANLGTLVLFIMWTRLNTGKIGIGFASVMCLGVQAMANLFFGLLLMFGEPYKQIGKAMTLVGLIMTVIAGVLFLNLLGRSH